LEHNWWEKLCKWKSQDFGYGTIDPATRFCWLKNNILEKIEREKRESGEGRLSQNG
jgi:hypothetical protein